MKIDDPHAPDQATDNTRKRRMEALLHAWREPPTWLRVEDARFTAAGSAEHAMSAVEAEAWSALLRHAQPIHPRTHRPGLAARASMLGLELAALESDKAVLVCGDRSATHWLGGPRPEAAQLGGHQWAMRVEPSAGGMGVEQAELVLRKRFREVEAHGPALVASTPWFGAAESIPVLLAAAFATDQQGELFRIFRMARVLGASESFVDLLPGPQRRLLTEALKCELQTSAPSLDAMTDARLGYFGEGVSQDRFEAHLEAELAPADFLPSRLASLLRARRVVGRLPREIGAQYFEDIVCALVDTADGIELATVLAGIPPGRTYFAAIEAVCRRRPELIATWVWHPSCAAEGAIALLELGQSLRWPDAVRVDLREEWSELQRLGREQLLFAAWMQDWPSVLALGMHDEAERISRTTPGPRPFPEEATYEEHGAWATTAADPVRSSAAVAILVDYYRQQTRHSDAALIFGMRLLAALRGSGNSGLAAALASSLVDAYSLAVQLSHNTASLPALEASGALLEGLREALGSGPLAAERWSTWLRPFDARAYFEAAKRSTSEPSSDNDPTGPRLDPLRTIRAHAQNLIAHAGAALDPGPSLAAAIELLGLDASAGLAVPAFSWIYFSRSTLFGRNALADPLFVCLGRALARHEDADRLDLVVKQGHGSQALAHLMVGIGGSGPLAARLEQPLRTSLNRELADPHGIALGHALELATSLHQAGLGRDAERFARRVIAIAEARVSHLTRPYLDAASAILAGALADQEMWPEVLAMDSDAVDEAHRQYIANMRALAHMGLEQGAEAKQLFSDLLRRDPNNRLALINRVALSLQLGDWQRALDEAEIAKARLPAGEVHNVVINEALARARLGDQHGAMATLQSPAASAIPPEELLAARQHVGAGLPATDRGVADVAIPRDAATAGAVAQPVVVPVHAAEPIDIAIITALREEYDAVRALLVEPTPAPPEATRRNKNLYAWILGWLPAANGRGRHRVVLAVAGQSGNLRSLHTTKGTIDQWSPRFVIFLGIAGGLLKNRLKQGDVVLSTEVWHYEYGKIVSGQYQPRLRDSFKAHSGLLNSALSFKDEPRAWQDCAATAPTDGHEPACLAGVIGSGEKVIDDLELPFVQAILAARADLQAVEMEAAGAAAAIDHAHDEGNAVGFIMVRGISDMPSGPSTDGGGGERAGTAQRDGWKRYASSIAANFVARWVASAWWPAEPSQR